MKNRALVVAGLVFLGVASLHYYRYSHSIEVIFNHFNIPLIWSLYGGALAGLLALWMFLAASK